MEWLMMDPQVHGTFSSLGSQVGETYVASPNCLDTLNEMLKKMSIEDRTLRTLRRAICYSQVVKKDLLPLLISVRDDRKITDTTIKVLADLTTPVECLLPIELMSKTEAGRSTIIELNWLLISCKETFLDPRGTKRIIDHIRDILCKGHELSDGDYEVLNDCVILLRNIFHIPDSMLNTAEGFSEQNQILWNLFAQNFDKLIIEMMIGPGRKEWRIALAQLVVLLYKDQRVATLQKLLNLWMEASEFSESSEDNESNTSPPEGDSFSSMVTSDQTDSSDNSGSDQKPEIKAPGKRKQSLKQQNIKKQDDKQSSSGTWSDTDQKMECSSSKMSDLGYGTQAENQESISTSSNEDDPPSRSMKPVHQKPSNMLQKSRYANGKQAMTTQEKEELKRKKLMRRFRSNMVNIKALLQHSPTEDDISHLLKEFTVDFLLKAYGTLVSELRLHLLQDPLLDRTHFAWLISYFLKFAVQLEIDLQHVKGVLTFEIISFLTFEGANLCEQYEQLRIQQESDLSTNLRKVHLVVSAIREILQTISSYKKMKHLNDSDKKYLSKLQNDISETEDLRCLFVLILRQFNPQVHSKQYLRDVIVTNHILLTFIENSMLPNATGILQSHMKQFVPVEMMRQYGYLLECFEENGHFVNDCVFTMMHHVAGDLENVTALFQPMILKTFSLIWENEFQVCDDWYDLIEYVIHKFINTPRSIPSVLMNNVNEAVLPTRQKEGLDGWGQGDSDCLYWYYIQSANSPDPVGGVIELYAEAGISNKSRIGVIEQLLKQDVITSCQYNELLEKEQITTGLRLQKFMIEAGLAVNEILLLKDYIMKEEKFGRGFILWLQRVFLETCFAKIFYHKNDCLIEPIPHHFTILKEPVPIIAWSCEQKLMMQSQVFLLFLHKLGLHLPADAGKAFARIPSTWGPKTLYSKALQLGPINEDWRKFNYFSVNYLQDNVFKNPGNMCSKT